MEQTREPLVQTNRQGMELALAQARLALEEGEVPVGAIVVDEMGRILAQAHNVTGAQEDPMAHGELLACLLYTSPSPRDLSTSRMPSSA